MIDVAGTLINQLRELGLTVAVAESLTGGLLADALVSVPGASRAFTGGIVAYDTSLKHTLLGVDSDLLRNAGPVHREVAVQMAEGVRHACAVNGRPADVGLSTTGVAGPDPDPQSGQSAGTVWIGWSVYGQSDAIRLNLSGDRESVRTETVQVILQQALLKLSVSGSSIVNGRE